MTNRERIICALRGGTPDRVPFTAYEWMWGDKEKAAELVKRGLGLTHHHSSYTSRCPDLSFEEEKFERDGYEWRRRVMKTPVGELEELYMGGWKQEFFIKEPADYKVLEHVARHSILGPNYDGFAEAEEQIGEDGVVILGVERSPIQNIMVSYVGVENFCYHLADGVQELHSCFEALKDQMIEIFKIIAKGPGEFVKLWENFTAEPFGPDRFNEFHMPVYQECAGILHAAGKRLMAHTDGLLSCVQHLLPQTGLDALESLTPPSEGDVPPERWREVWPELALWANIPVSWYLDPPEKFAARLRDLLDRIGSPKGLLLEISEDLPSNWADSLPVVLDVLQEAGA